MKVKNLMMLALFACGLTMMTVSCDKDNPKPTPQPGNTVKSKTIDATNYSNWTYINLETGETEVHRDFSEWLYLKNMHPDTIVSRTHRPRARRRT